MAFILDKLFGGEVEREVVEVKMNDPAANAVHKYPTNFIKTSTYNIFTFLPLNLFFQFKKVSNFYFLVNMIFALIPGVSPINPATSVMPLVFVVGVALIKDGYEDYLRHKADNLANSIEAHVIRPDGRGGYVLTDVESKDVQVGDIMKINLGEEIRADVILLSSSLQEGQAFIDTCNLDGETNLKNRKGIEKTWQYNDERSLTTVDIRLTTSPASPALLSWTGVLRINGQEESVGLDQFMYRSAVLRNTDWVWGLVAFAGVDTKMFRNLAQKPPKTSNLDRKLNFLILGVFLIQQILIILMASLACAFNSRNEDKHWYVEHYLKEHSGITLWGYRYLAYFILMSYLIPISLFVTIELCKVAQSTLMKWDVEMFEYMHGKWQNCNPNTSNLNEELSRVKFIFTDKTGTLTENVMVFKKGDFLGNSIDSDDQATSLGYLQSKDPIIKGGADDYFRALAICHTIQPFPDPDRPEDPEALKYEGASPDEAALVQTAVEHGFVLKDRSTRTMGVVCPGFGLIKFEIMATLEFTPDRKMMSIIVRDPTTGRIFLYTKGADSFVMPHLADDEHNGTYLPPTSDSLKDMAATGLRTLLVCKKEVTQQQFDAWYARFIEAGKTLTNRSEAVDKVCLEMEHDMTLVGATAIEDRLQDKVPETLQFFLSAGVIVWMLTGDKRETAVTIAATSRLADPMNDYVEHIDIGDLSSDSPEAARKVREQLEVVNQCIQRGDKKVTFVVDGPALMVCMKPEQKDEFIRLSQLVSSAVCCRLTPLQKASVVNMFQVTTGLTALAIGDGANDVSMIQEGKVGVGIVGLEGAQAALAADYAIPRFKHLKRLCCVHGRYALVRNAYCILVSFYKNIMLSLTQFYFCFWAGYSGMSLIDGWLLTFYNLAFTSLPPLFLGIFEKDLDEGAVMDNPQLYPPLADGAYFDYFTIFRWFLESVVHSLIIYFVLFQWGIELDVQEKRVMDVGMFGTVMCTIFILISLSRMALHVRYWVVQNFVVLLGSAIFYVVFVCCYAAVPDLFGQTSFYWSFYILMSDPKFWFFNLLVVGGCIFTFDMAIIFIQKQKFPTPRDIVQARYDAMAR